MATETPKMLKVEHDVITGELIEREMTAAEIAQYEADIKALNDERAERERLDAEKAAAKEAALTKLGLTADEVAAILS